MKLKINYLLILIFFLGILLRFIKLDSFPVSFSWDEVAIGYNAFTIAEKGIDEYGNKYPLLFKSFEDFKLPGYIYTDALFIKALGFSDFTVRLPSALSGAFLIIAVYFLFKKIFSERIGLITSFLVAISPWALQFSRAAFEANLALFITVLGITLFFYGFKNKIFAFISFPILFLSLYFYYSQRIIVPLIFLALLFLYRKGISKNLKQYISGLFLALILIAPMIVQILGPQGAKRIAEVSIFSNSSISSEYLIAREKNSDKFYSFLINRRSPYIFETLHGYFQNLSFGFLFFGDDPSTRHRSFAHGLLYIVEIPLLLFGFYLIIKSKRKKEKFFILFWMLIAPISSALSKEAPHGLRSLTLFIPLLGIIAIAIENLITNHKKIIVLFLFLYPLSLVNYILSYYFVYPVSDSYSWAYGHKQMYERIFSLEEKYERIVVTGDYWKPRIFYQYYKRSLPEKIEKKGDFEVLRKYFFASTYWDNGSVLDEKKIKNLKENRMLLVLSPSEYEGIKNSPNYSKIEEIRDYSGRKIVFVIGEWNSKNTD